MEQGPMLHAFYYFSTHQLFFMNAVTVIGRYLFAIPLVIFGLIYLVNAETLTQFIETTGSVIWVYITGLIMLFAGIAILIRKKDAVASFLLGILFIILALVIDLRVAISLNFDDPVSTSQLLKDLIIAGAAFVYCRSAAKDRTWRLV